MWDISGDEDVFGKQPESSGQVNEMWPRWCCERLIRSNSSPGLNAKSFLRCNLCILNMLVFGLNLFSRKYIFKVEEKCLSGDAACG